MKATRCLNGHWYDEETYDKCPHCGLAKTSPNQPQNTPANKKNFSLFKKDKKQKSMAPAAPVSHMPPMAPMSSVPPKAPAGPMSHAPQNGVVRSQVPPTPPTPPTPQSDVTEQLFLDLPSTANDNVTEQLYTEIPSNPPVANVVSAPASQSAPVPPQNEMPSPFISPSQSSSEPLAAAVQRASAMDDGKTLGFFNAMVQKTADESNNEVPHNTNPVAGWLVAVAGPHLGDSFSLYVGKNAIGRSTNNKVILSLDKSVSRENQATVIYEPKKREFYLQVGESDGLVYLNDSFINGMQALNSKDIIEIGSTKLMFMPLCGNDFSWEQYI